MPSIKRLLTTNLFQPMIEKQLNIALGAPVNVYHTHPHSNLKCINTDTHTQRNTKNYFPSNETIKSPKIPTIQENVSKHKCADSCSFLKVTYFY